jgi:membrane protein
VAIGVREGFGLLKGTVKDFLDDNCTLLAAALSYYTVFSLPPLLILLLMMAGAVWDPQDVQNAIHTQIGGLLGPSGAEGVKTMMQHAEQPEARGVLPTLVGIGALIFGATGAFIQLQSALNRAWEVEPDPAQGGIKNFIVKRVFSFGLILAIAFLLLVSLAMSAALAAFGDALGRMVPGVSEVLLQAFSFVLSFGVITLLFAAMFKVMPDAEIAWRDVWVGALFTAFLFVVGKFALGFYLGRSDPGSAYGAAGSLALILVWIYYASMIVLLGAEFTQMWADERGSGLEPEKGAVRVKEEKRRLRGARAEAEVKGEAAAHEVRR